MIGRIMRTKFNSLNLNFLSKLSKKYNNNINLSEYIVERLKFQTVDTIFVTQYKPYVKMLSPFIEIAEREGNLNVIFNKYELGALYAAMNYTEYSNNIGVLINSTDSEFNCYSDILCCTNPLLSILFYDTQKNLKSALVETQVIHPCFKDAFTIRRANSLPGILEYMLKLSVTMPTAPVQLNISTELLEEKIDLTNIYNDLRNLNKEYENIEDLDELQFVEKLYEKDKKEEKLYKESVLNPKKSLEKYLNIHTELPNYKDPPLL